MSEALLENRDYTIIIDKSSSMSASEEPDGISRWEMAQESALVLAKKCEEFDPDGITIYLFSSHFQRFDRTTSDRIPAIFQQEFPAGNSNLSIVLQDAISNYFDRKSLGQAKTGETILVLTDGEPFDRWAVVDVIINAASRIDRDEELAISFIQVGTDIAVTRFLKGLDDKLQEVGAKFDICDTITLEEMESMSLTEVLLKAITD